MLYIVFYSEGHHLQKIVSPICPLVASTATLTEQTRTKPNQIIRSHTQKQRQASEAHTGACAAEKQHQRGQTFHTGSFHSISGFSAFSNSSSVIGSILVGLRKICATYFTRSQTTGIDSGVTCGSCDCTRPE